MTLLFTGISFAQTRWRGRNHPRPAFERWQNNAVARWLKHDVPQVPFYAPTSALTDLPMTDKATLMANFAAFNRLGISAKTVEQTLISGQIAPNGPFVGASTGTSGNRGFYVISARERFRWLGSILAKAIPDILWRPHRVAVILPQNAPLYDAAPKTGRVHLLFLPLTKGARHWQSALTAFNPTVIVAPPKVLRHLAETDTNIAPLHLFSAAETLDPVDANAINARFPGVLGQIYMATEGLLGVTCPRGTLHLAEDSVFFEYEPVGDGLVAPIISSFARQTQIMARYRMNDLLRLADRPCACGSPLQAVDEVVGRMDDIFHLSGGVMVTPDILRNAVLDADRSITDFRLVQDRADHVTLTLPLGTHQTVQDTAAQAVRMTMARLGGHPKLMTRTASLPLETHAKRRRVHSLVTRP